MRWPLSTAAALLVALTLAAPARAEGGGLVLLGRAGFADEELALVEALRIYTRDLQLPIARGGALSETEPLTQAESEGRRHAAALVVWFGGEPELPALFAWRVATGTLRATPATPRDDRDLCAQTLALKLRALLMADTGDLRDWQPATVAVPTGARDGAVTTPAPSPPPASSSRAWGLEAGVAYALALPADTATLRHGFQLRAGVALARLPLDLTLDGGYGFRAETTTVALRAGVWDLPLGLALSLRLRRPRFQLGVGPRLGLHLFAIDATTSDGRANSERVLAAGLGGVGEARLILTGRVALFLTLSAEALLPRHRFLVDGAVAVDLGTSLVALCAGLIVRLL